MNKPVLLFVLAGATAGAFVILRQLPAGTQLARIGDLPGIVSLPLLLFFGRLGVFPWLGGMIVQFLKGRTEDRGRQVEEQG